MNADNVVVLTGRLTRDPDIRYTQGENQTCFARFTLAVDRHRKIKEGTKTADFISCKAWGHTAEFLEKYARKGVKLTVAGSIETGSYQNREGTTVYTTDVDVESCNFAESKKAQEEHIESTSPSTVRNEQKNETVQKQSSNNDFMKIPEGIEEELPFT